MSDAAAGFRDLHHNTLPLTLPNAWDAGSARLFESLGAPAIATTSAGVAWALGHPDGRALPMSEVLGVAARMTRVLSVPLSFDLENGYSDDPAQVADHVMRLADLGVAGINIEDGPDQPALLAAKIGAIRAALARAGSDLFVNVRCDVFLAGLVGRPLQVGETIARGLRYREAGADGLFVPGIVQGEDIRAVAAGVPLPLNAMAWPGLADAAELGRLGVRRLSAGSGLSQVLWGKAERLAREFLERGGSAPLSDSPMPYPQLQGLFAG